MSVAVPVPPQETTHDRDYAAVVEFGLLGLRAEFQRAQAAVRTGDEAELGAAQAQARRLFTMLGLLPEHGPAT